MPTVAVVIIGNEILSGKFVEENAAWLIGRLRTLGAELRRIVVIPDELDVIADEVARCAAGVDWVVTSGGVGPTHDDLTMEGIARGFGLPLVVDPVLRGLLVSYGLPEQGPALRMATVPEGAERFEGHRGFPVVRVKNVYVLPGVPRLFRAKFEAVAAHFAGVPLHTGHVVTDEDETALAARLDAVVARFPEVAFGSYPRFEERPPVVVITAEGRDAEAVARAVDALAAAVRVVSRSAR